MEESSLKNRINEKIEDIENYLDELKEIAPKKLEGYKKDTIKKAACKRYAEKIIEALEDLAFLMINIKKLNYPEEEYEIFDILEKNEIISQNLKKRLKDAKGMRNRIAHQYGQIDDEIVYRAVKDELNEDANEFIKSVRINIK